MLLSLLDTKNPCYDAESIKDLRALYKGGKVFRSRIERFLPKRPVEDAGMYEVRKKEAHYRNYIAPIINQFCAVLFSSKPIVRVQEAKASGEIAKRDIGPEDDFYSKWRSDCDDNGKNLEAFFQERLTEAMTEKIGFFVIEHPRDDPKNPVTDKAEFKKLGLDQVRLRKVDGTEVYDWERDDTGKLIWAIVHQTDMPRLDPTKSRDTIVETWEIFTDTQVLKFRMTWDKKNGRPPGTTDVAQVDAKAHRFGEVPLIELELLEDLWIGNLLESPQTAHFRIANAETWAIARTCYAMPVFNIKDDTKPPTMGAGYGIYIGVDEKMGWSAPPDTPFEATNRTAATLKDEIFRIAQQMAMGVDNNAAAVGRSADSKLADAGMMRVVLMAFSRKVKEVIERVYDLASTARGDDYEWSIEGFDSFDAADLAGLMELMTELSVASIPSKTFNVELKQRVAEAALPDLDQAKKDAIKQEISDGIDAEEELSQHMREQAMMPPNPDNAPPPNGKAKAPKPGKRVANPQAARGGAPAQPTGGAAG